MNKRFVLRRLVLILNLLMISMMSLAQESQDCIIIHMKSGNKVLVKIEEYPKFVFENQTISFNTEKYQISNVSKYTFGNYKEEIDTKIKSPSAISATKDGFVYIKAANPKSEVNVYSINGIILDVDTKIHDGNLLEVNLNGLPNGVYLLYVDGEYIKIQKR